MEEKGNLCLLVASPKVSGFITDYNFFPTASCSLLHPQFVICLLFLCQNFDLKDYYFFYSFPFLILYTFLLGDEKKLFSSWQINTCAVTRDRNKSFSLLFAKKNRRKSLWKWKWNDTFSSLESVWKGVELCGAVWSFYEFF